MPSFAIASLAAAALFASQVAAQAVSTIVKFLLLRLQAYLQWSNATCVDQLWVR